MAAEPEIQVGIFSPRIGVRQYFAAEHLWAARLASGLCREAEKAVVKEGFSGVDYRVRSFALMAITESVAFLDAYVSEIWQDAADAEPGTTNPRLDGMTEETKMLLRELRQYDAVERSLRLLEKFDAVLHAARKGKVDKRRHPYQDVQPLIQLRNALIHFKPETQWSDEEHKLKKRLQHRLRENPLLRNTQPWFPHQPLCADGAEWAWRSSLAYAEEWREQLGLTLSCVAGMDQAAPWPDPG